MKQTWRSNLLDELIRIISVYAPDYVKESPEASEKIFALVDSMDDFEESLVKHETDWDQRLKEWEEQNDRSDYQSNETNGTQNS